MSTLLQIALDCVGTEAEVEQIAAEAAASCPGVNYEVCSGVQWPTIVATSYDAGELNAFANLVYEDNEDYNWLIAEAQ